METQKKKKEAKQEQKNKEAEENDNNNDKEIIQQEFLDKRDDKRDEKIAELTGTLKRLQADFENYKKRADREKDTYSKNANTRLIEKFLPLLDSFALAVKNSTISGNASDSGKFRKGIEMIYAQFYSTLQNEGLRPIETLGKKFDPYKHEVLMQEESEQDNIVLEEFQKGYMLHDHILRHSKVKIGVKKYLVDASENNSENKNSESDEQNQKENQGKNQE